MIWKMRGLPSRLLLLLLLILPTLVSCQLDWHLFHNGAGSSAPSVREDAMLGYDQARNRLILFGGKGEDERMEKILDDTWAFNIASGTWVQLSLGDSPTARFSAVYGVSGKYFYVATGESKNNKFLNDIWRFNLETDSWEELPSHSKPDYYTEKEWDVMKRDEVEPEFRYGAAGGIFPNSSRLYVSHGFDDKRYANTFTYNTLDEGWSREYPDRNPYNPTYPHARCLGGSAMISAEELIMFGGCLSGGGTAGPCPAGDSWIFNGKMKKWTQAEGCANPRVQPSMALLPIKNGQRRVILYGGDDAGGQVISVDKYPPEQVGVFNPDTKEWTLRKTSGAAIPKKRRSAAMASGQDGVFMFGGYDLNKKDRLNDLFLLAGDGSTADKAPKDADCSPTFINFILLHGIFMGLGWGLFLFWGAFIARFFKHRAPLWFNLHRLFQIFGLILTLGGFACGVASVQFDHFKFAHAIIGLVVTLIAIFQPINAVLRPHNPEEGMKKPVRRVLWEFLHRMLGRSAIILGLVNISLGVFLAVSHHVVWKVWFAYLALILCLWLVAEIRKKHCEKKMSKSENIEATGNKFVINTGKVSHYENPVAIETQSADGASSIGKPAPSSVNGN